MLVLLLLILIFRSSEVKPVKHKLYYMWHYCYDVQFHKKKKQIKTDANDLKNSMVYPMNRTLQHRIQYENDVPNHKNAQDESS